jgi:cytochrome P450
MAQSTDRLDSFNTTVDREPYDYYDRLREAGDVVWDQDLHALLVGSYDLVRSLLRQDGRVLRKPRAEEFENDPVWRSLVQSPRVISATVGKEHARYHTWWLKAYSRANVERWRPTRIRPVVHAMIDRFAPRGGAELVAEFSAMVPMRVIASLIGLPWQDEEWIESCRAYIDVRAEYLQVCAAQNEAARLEVGRRAMTVAADFVEKLRPYALRGPLPDGDDIITMFWNDGPTIFADWTADDVLTGLITSFFAGSHTTAAASANGIYTLLTSPEVRSQLRSGGAPAMEVFVDEALRISGGGHFMQRFANEDMVVGGIQVKKDDLVVLLRSAASRDPRHYECPADVDLGRTNPRDHMTFAMGPRSCAGMWLARGELAEMYTGLLDRLHDLRLDPDAEPPRLKGFQSRSYKPLHVLFSAEDEKPRSP